MMPYLFILLSSIVIRGTLASGHALYISVIQLDHIALSDTAQVTIKVFTDDLENALRNASPDFIKFDQGTYNDSGKAHIQRYFAEHFRCNINGQSASLLFRSLQRENDVFWLSFVIPCPKKWENFELSANFFMELFPTQSNIVKISAGDEKRFFRLTKKEHSCEWRL